MDNYGWLIILILRLHFEGVVNYSTQPLNIDGRIGKLSGRGQRDRPTHGQGLSSAEVVRYWEDT